MTVTLSSPSSLLPTIPGHNSPFSLDHYTEREAFYLRSTPNFEDLQDLDKWLRKRDSRIVQNFPKYYVTCPRTKIALKLRQERYYTFSHNNRLLILSPRDLKSRNWKVNHPCK